MWLHLVNGVYCFLPKDSCSSIRPLIHLLIFLAAFFVPILSSLSFRNIQYPDVKGGPPPRQNKWSAKETPPPEKKNKRNNKIKGSCVGRQEVKVERRCVKRSLPLWSFAASHDLRCSYNELGKQGMGGVGGREGSPSRERCLRLNQIYIIKPHCSYIHPLLLLFYITLPLI